MLGIPAFFYLADLIPGRFDRVTAGRSDVTAKTDGQSEPPSELIFVADDCIFLL